MSRYLTTGSVAPSASFHDDQAGQLAGSRTYVCHARPVLPPCPYRRTVR